MSKVFICETCTKEFKTSSGWWKHRKNFPEHVENTIKPKVNPAEVAVAEFLSAGNEGNYSWLWIGYHCCFLSTVNYFQNNVYDYNK